MATTYTYNITRNELISAALRAIGVLGLNQTAAADDISHCSEALNIMIKQWGAKGTTLWKVEELTIAMVAGTASYGLGPATSTTRPLRILELGNFIRTTASGLDTSVALLGRSDYEQYGAKASTGTVNSFYYDPLLTNGTVKVYPTPSTSSTHVLHLFAQMPFADMLLAADAPQFSQEFLAPLKWGLARELLVEYGCDEATERRIEMRYQETLKEGLDFSQDMGSTYFQYNTRGR